MSNKFPLLLALFSLVACDEPVTTLPVPDEAMALQNGVYILSVDKIIELECDADAREISNWKAELGLAIKGREAHGRLDGIELEGQAKGAFVYLDGDIPMGDEPSQPPRDRDEDHEDEGEDTGSGGGSTGEDSDDSDGNEASAKCEVEDEGEEDSDIAEPARDDGVSLDLEAVGRHEARGVFVVDVPGCFAELKVRAVFERPLEEGPVVIDVEEETEPVEEEEESPCDNGEEDCG